MIRLLLSLTIVFTLTNAFAQNGYPNNAKAQKAFDKAVDEYRLKQDDKAFKSLQKALEIDPDYVAANYLIALIYESYGDLKNAKKYFQKGASVNPKINPFTLLKVAKLEMKYMEYKSAALHLKQFVEFNRNRLKDGDLALVSKLFEDCKFAVEAMETPVDFNPVNMGPNINTSSQEMYPSITADGKYFLFTRVVESDMAPMGAHEDFYISEKLADGSWGEAYNLGSPVNSPDNNEGAATFSADGQLIILTICEGIYGYPKGREGYGSCDLYATNYGKGNFKAPKNLGNTINSGYWETQPSFSSDGKTLYFIRGKHTNENYSDIYVSTLGDEGWSKPQRLPDNINSPYAEQTVFIHPDGQTLYFSSKGHPGMGGLDFFYSKKQADGSWGDPINMGYPVNTPDDEFSLLVDRNGTLAYFASDREGGSGKFDIYQFELPQKARSVGVTYLEGLVFDEKSKAPLSAEFELIDLSTSEVVVNNFSNPYSGEFLVTLPKDRDYALVVNKKGYLPYSESFRFKVEDPTKPFHKDVPLKKIEAGVDFVLKNIFFETAKYDLKDESEAELSKLIEFLEYNDNLSIEIGGHTDNIGSEENNQILSDNRANAVKQYLINHGIDASRLQHKGYGEEKPIASNETEEGRAQNRRTAFKVIAIN